MSERKYKHIIEDGHLGKFDMLVSYEGTEQWTCIPDIPSFMNPDFTVEDVVRVCEASRILSRAKYQKVLDACISYERLETPTDDMMTNVSVVSDCPSDIDPEATDERSSKVFYDYLTRLQNRL